MTDHHTLEPTAAVHVRAGEPGGATAVAAVADLVCADDELLRAEFDAIIAANFPGAAERRHPLRPDTTVMTTTEWVSARRWPTPPDRRPGRGNATAAKEAAGSTARTPARVGSREPDRPRTPAPNRR